VAAIFEHITFIVVDELHAFIGSERGKQLQSLMHRIERALARRIPRIGLSATLGDMTLAGNFLSPGGEPTQINSEAGGSELKVLVKGYEEPLAVRDGTRIDNEKESITPGLITAHLFRALRGSNNLVFPNSRREVERYTHLLNKMCEVQKVPNEFWPHHGSLSKEIRSETEAALKQRELPATAICTNTLELGIDIGSVRSVAQIGPPPSVASLRQRLGRSGRRKGEPAILRGYCVEQAIGPSANIRNELRLDTVQMAAMISLLIEKWFEPPRVQGVHLSTLVQQLLSSISQTGGATAGELYALFCEPGTPFAGLTKQEFMDLLRHMALKELLVQDSSGVLLHGRVGEKLVNHYSFYAAFSADEEFRVVAGGKMLGSLPVDQLLLPGQRILFAGKTWRVEEVDEQQKTIYVARAQGGVAPIFSGGVGRTHTKVRERMRHILESTTALPFMDEAAQRFLDEARSAYVRHNLASAFALDQGREVLLLTWLGDAANEAMACLLVRRGYMATPSGPGVEVLKGEHSIQDVVDVLGDFAVDDVPPVDLLLAQAKNIAREKWDWALPDGLLRKTYASLNLELNEAVTWARQVTGTAAGG
jgi:ATP-dependent Lhr-like helicase